MTNDEISQEEREWIDTRFETIFLKSDVAELWTRMIVTRVKKTLTWSRLYKTRKNTMINLTNSMLTIKLSFCPVQ